MLFYQIILCLTFIHVISWIFFIKRKRKLDIYEPIYIISLLYLIVFVWAPYTWILNGQTSYQGVEVIKYLPIGSLYFNIGYLSFAIGYIFKLNKYSFNDCKKIKIDKFPSDRLFLNNIIKYGFILLLFNLCLTLIYYQRIGRNFLFIMTLGQGYKLSNAKSGLGFYFLMEFQTCLIPSILFLYSFKDYCQEKYKFVLYIFIYIISMIFIASGFRYLFIMLCLSLFSYIYMSKRTQPSIKLLLIIFFIFYLFVGIIGMYRGTIKAGKSIDLSQVSSNSLLIAFMYNVEIFFPFYNLVGYASENLIGLNYGLGILNIFIQLIPRIIWTNKPATLGKTAYEAMYGNSFGGAAYPNIGAFYYEFGIIGIIIFMFMFGFYSYKIYYFSKNSNDKIQYIYYSLFYGYIIQFVCRGNFSTWVMDILFLFVPIYILNKYIKNYSLKNNKIY